MLELALFTAVLSAAAFTDLNRRTIPNGIVLAGLGTALLLATVEAGGIPTAALLGGALGLAIGFALFALGALGGGDGKLLAVVGAFLGPQGLLLAILYAGVAGGVLALTEAVRRGVLIPVLLGVRDVTLHLVTFGHKGERRTLTSPGAVSVPYGVAIAIGALVAWFLPAIPGGA